MDEEELRLNCLRMAYELGGKTEAIISAAIDLMNFVTKGSSADARAAALEPAGAPNEVSPPAAEPVVTDRIAACGTALEMPEGGDLAHAEPAVEVKAAAEAELATEAEVTEAVPSQATAEEAAPIAAPTAEVEAAQPAAAPSPEPVESLAEVTNGGSADLAAAPEVEAAAMAAGPAVSGSEEIAPSSEEHAAAPVTDGAGQEHVAN